MGVSWIPVDADLDLVSAPQRMVLGRQYMGAGDRGVLVGVALCHRLRNGLGGPGIQAVKGKLSGSANFVFNGLTKGITDRIQFRNP